VRFLDYLRFWCVFVTGLFTVVKAFILSYNIEY